MITKETNHILQNIIINGSIPKANNALYNLLKFQKHIDLLNVNDLFPEKEEIKDSEKNEEGNVERRRKNEEIRK